MLYRPNLSNWSEHLQDDTYINPIFVCRQHAYKNKQPTEWTVERSWEDSTKIIFVKVRNKWWSLQMHTSQMSKSYWKWRLGGGNKSVCVCATHGGLCVRSEPSIPIHFATPGMLELKNFRPFIVNMRAMIDGLALMAHNHCKPLQVHIGFDCTWVNILHVCNTIRVYLPSKRLRLHSLQIGWNVHKTKSCTKSKLPLLNAD